jgi:A/G-specific adenine glycosylase
MSSLISPLPHKSAFRRRLLQWYDRNRRELPWRGTRDPYQVWLSEIMLQQTRVNAVLGHYRRFLAQFPTVKDLASAREASVLAAWSGLGYYRRARMLRKAAQEVAANGFPSTAQGWQELPGIGRYTAAAIASIAFNEPSAVVDGNVERVVRRLAGKPMAQTEIWEVAQGMIAKQRPGDFNQAMMELGAVVCVPVNPECGACPVKRFCGSVGKPMAAKPRVTRKVAALHYGFARRPKSILLVQRDGDAKQMAGMWELPSTEAGDTPLLQLRHSITTTDYRIEIHAAEGTGLRGRWISLERAARLPLTGLARKVLTRLGAIASPV